MAESEWEETGHSNLKLDIDLDKHFLLEDAGKLKVFVCRLEGRLVGYIVCIIDTLLTSKYTTVGHLEAVYVHKDHRNSSVGKSLYLFTESCLREDGVNVIVASSSVKNPINSFLEHLGYQETETKVGKVL